MVFDRARTRALTAALVVLVVLASSAGCTPASDGATGTLPRDRAAGAGAEPPSVPSLAPSAPAEAGTQTPADGTVLVALATLEVKGRAPRTGYSREAFGQAWADVDRNGCDTRNDVLRRDLVEATLKPGTRDCVVLTGRLEDPYSGRSMSFQRGERSAEVQIDHVVALSDAWQKGAQSWTPTKRETFANDPLNLLAVDGVLNAQKGAGDAATWLPPSRPSWCAYAARQVAVKAAYAVWVTPAERDALQRILTGCPDTGLPTEPAVTGAVEPSAPPAPGADAPTQPAASEQQTDPRFPFCKDLPGGYGPYVAGVDPEYEWYRDGDSDGTACDR